MDRYNYFMARTFLQLAKESDNEIMVLSFLLSSVIRLSFAIKDIQDPEVELREDVSEIVREAGLYGIFSEIMDEMFSLITNERTRRAIEIVNNLQDFITRYSAPLEDSSYSPRNF
ncbi:hypothetical protein [Metallosphaera javensis (ex Sakai et al. 2022)]|uniref:hypothetical protein n=1 Tax=Metallosphaera javensis (ex Sakai et al. 2022) TaxID=2775498 RepID=UPI0025860344|nr:MAG: hypothetical protein MjAS7_1763 [Metallosphaera javensis (ex Sakai et al. 2022)]